MVVFIRHPSDEFLQLESTQQLSELMYQSLRRINPENNFKPNKFLIADPERKSEIELAAWRSIELEPFENVWKVLPQNAPGLNPHFFEIIGSRTAAPVSYMVSKHPGELAGPVNEVVVIKEPYERFRKAVLIKLGPTLTREG